MHPNSIFQLLVMIMKAKKSLRIYVISAILGIGLIACGDDYTSRLPELIIKDMAFESGLSTQEQVFRKEDLSNYSLSSSAEWCIPSIDVETSTLSVTVRANDDYDARTATVTLTDIKDATTRYFTVTQKQKDGLFTNDSIDYEVPMAGGSLEIPVQSNVSYDVEIPASDNWITLATDAKTRGLEDSKVYLNIAKNNSYGVRQGSVTVLNRETGLSHKVTIRQQFEIEFSVEDTKPIEFDEFGGDYDFKVHSNIPLYTYATRDWASLGSRLYSDEDNFVLPLHVAALKQKVRSRTCSVVISNTSYKDSHAKAISSVISVTQYRPLFIEESEYSIKGNERLALDLYNRDNIAVNWTSSNERVATVNAEGVVMGVGDGECTITVTSADGKRSDYCKVIVDMPVDPTSLVKCRWAYSTTTDSHGTDSVSAVNCTFTNNSDVIIYMQSRALYNDGKRISYEKFDSPGLVVAANGGSLLLSEDGRLKVDSGFGYYAEWVFYCDEILYTLRYDDEGEFYISKGSSGARSRAASSSRRK